MARRRVVPTPGSRRDADGRGPPSAALRLRGAGNGRAWRAADARTQGRTPCRPQRGTDLRATLSGAEAAAIPDSAPRDTSRHRYLAPAGAVSDGGRRSIDPNGQGSMARRQIRPPVPRTTGPGGNVGLPRVRPPQRRDQLAEGHVSARVLARE